MTVRASRSRPRAASREASSFSASLGLRMALVMEGLWLAAIGLVPVVFAPSSLMLFVDVPRVALLRAIATLLAALWALEWAMKPSQPHVAKQASIYGGLKAWAGKDLSRWALLAALAFLAANAVSTLLSPAPSASLWGNNPGRDGYSAYSMASYLVIFFVIATHLRTQARLWRILAVVSASTATVAAYGVLQHFGIDPFNQGGAARVTASFGNALFAGSYLAAAVPISLGLGLAIALRSRRPWTMAAWAAVVAVQVAALVFTLSRGPWLGLGVGWAVWLGLVALFAGRTAFLRAIHISGVAAALSAAIALVPAQGAGGSMEAGPSPLVGRAASIGAEVSTGEMGGRVSIWKRGASTLIDRPWYDPGTRGNALVRHVFGYGPEMFLYAMPLKWDAAAREPVNASAHNQPLHLAVELGLAGLVAYVAFVALVLATAARFFMRQRGRMPVGVAVVYAALVGSLVARLVEQMTGVARISDTLLFWVVAALIVAAPGLAEHPVADIRFGSSEGKRRNAARLAWWQLPAFRWSAAIIASAAAAFLVVEKNVSYVMASAFASSSVQAFHNRDLLGGLGLMDRAIALAPDVEFYYTARAQMMGAFIPRDASDEAEIATEQYRLNRKALEVSPLSHTARLAMAASALRLYELGQEDRGAEAVGLYRELNRMISGYQPLYHDLAAAYLVTGQPEKTLEALDEYGAITGGKTDPGGQTYYIRGVAHHQAGHHPDAIAWLEEYLSAGGDGVESAADAHWRLAELYAESGQHDKQAEHQARYEALRQR